jgi:hypothetical protein
MTTVSYVSPHMINQICLKLIVSVTITDLMMHMEELFKLCCPMFQLNQFTLEFPPLVKEAIITRILNILCCA